MKEHAYLLEDKEKTSLTEYELFDKVINLRLSARNRKTNKVDTFIIRSDFEAHFKDSDFKEVFGESFKSNSYIIKKVEYKPSIKVQYNQVSETTQIDFDIFISNFFLNTKDGQFLMAFNDATYKLEEVSLQMGYFSQFQKRLGADTKKPNWGLTYSNLFEDFDKGSSFGVQTIKINVSDVRTEKLPPNSVLRIHGYVGSTVDIAVNGKKVSKEESKNFEDMKGEAEDIYSDDSKSLMENLFFYYITRRFQNIKIKDEEYVAPVVGENNVFTKDFAEENGVKVHLSKWLKEWEEGSEIQFGNKDSNKVKKYTRISFGGYANTLDSAVKRIAEFIGCPLSSMRLNDGSIYVFEADRYTHLDTDSEDEDTDDEEEHRKFIMNKMIEDTKYFNENTPSKNYWEGKIPAVYNINIDASALIVCPFYTFLNPFEEIKFSARYPLSNLVTYWGGFKPTTYKFLVYNMSVSFATVENINEMQIKSISWSVEKEE